MFLGLYILPHNAEQGLVDGRGIKQSSEIVRAILFDRVASYVLNYYIGSDQALPERVCPVRYVFACQACFTYNGPMTLPRFMSDIVRDTTRHNTGFGTAVGSELKSGGYFGRDRVVVLGMVGSR